MAEEKHPIYGSAAELIFLTANMRTYEFEDEHIKHMMFSLIPILIAFFKRQAERGNPWVIDAVLNIIEWTEKGNHPISTWMRKYRKLAESGVEQFVQMYPKEFRVKNLQLERRFIRLFNSILGDATNIQNLSHAFSAIEVSLSTPDDVQPYVPAKVEYSYGILQEAVAKYLRDQLHRKYYVKYERRIDRVLGGRTGHPICPRVKPIHGAKAVPEEYAGCVITSTCLMIMILLDATSDLCFVCLEEAKTSCEKCLLLHYCSDVCQGKDKDRHKQECTFFKV